MKARAKSINTPCPVWIYGEYTNMPPPYPHNGKARPRGYYIDEGGYPGANVYEIDIATLCRHTGIADRAGKDIYIHDILLYEKMISYLVVLDEAQAMDIVTGEVMEIKDLSREDIKVTGNLFDNPGFIHGIRHIAEEGLDMPYLPGLNVVSTALPFLKLTCLECGHVTLASRYTLACKECGGYYMPGYATEIKREKASV